jgi:hypothetical protein
MNSGLPAHGMASRIACALCAALLILCMIGSQTALAQAQTTTAEEAQLELEFTDPLTTLPQIFLKDAYSPANFGTHVQTNQVILRAIIPRVPRFSLFPFIQLIRPTFSLVTVPSSRGGTRTEFGDTQLFDLAVLPWPGEGTGLKFGLGPMFVFPTASSKSAGQGSWQAGPAIGSVYTGISWLWRAFCYRIRFPSHTPRPIACLRIRCSSSQFCSFISGRAGTCGPRRQLGWSVGVTTLRQLYP